MLCLVSLSQCERGGHIGCACGLPRIPEPGCSGPVKPGDYQVTLDEKKTTQSTVPSCGELDSIAVGLTLPVTIGSMRQQLDCAAYEAEVTLSSSVVVLGPTFSVYTDNHQSSIGVFVKKVDISGCTGTLEIFLSAPPPISDANEATP